MTRQELDAKLTAHGCKPNQLYTLEDAGWGEIFVIRKEHKKYKIYYNERGVDYYQSEAKTLEDAYDYIWEHYFRTTIIPLRNLNRDNK